jgi:hypothetical protein
MTDLRLVREEKQSNWVIEAPRRCDPTVVASISRAGDEVLPSISFAFQGLTPEDLITVTLIATEFDLRKFQKNLDKAITLALREAR